MTNQRKKKGFTLVELVIVIAVIAILAAVLIPTFSNVQKKAKESAALQQCSNVYSIVVMNNQDAASETAAAGYFDVSSDSYFVNDSTATGSALFFFKRDAATGEFSTVKSSAIPADTYVLCSKQTSDADNTDEPGNVIMQWNGSALVALA